MGWGGGLATERGGEDKHFLHSLFQGGRGGWTKPVMETYGRAFLIVNTFPKREVGERKIIDANLEAHTIIFISALQNFASPGHFSLVGQVHLLPHFFKIKNAALFNCIAHLFLRLLLLYFLLREEWVRRPGPAPPWP